MKYFILLMMMLVQLFSAQNLEKVTLQLQWYHQFQFAGYYMAKEKGFYKDVGLDVEIKKYKSDINPVDQVISKKANYATGRSSLIIDSSKGKGVVALAAILQSSPLVLVARLDSGIHRIEDLHGKRVGGDHTTVNTVSILAMLKKKNIVVDYTPGDNTKNDIENLLDKNVDVIAAYVTNEIYTLTHTNVKFIVFNPKNYKFNFYSDILFSSEDEVNIHPQRTRNFKNASLKGWEYAFSHIDETVQLILDKYNTQNKTKEALTFEANKLRELAYYKTDKIGRIDNSKIKNIYNIYKNLGLVENSIDLNIFIFREDNTPSVIFTEEETAYLKQKKEITVCGQRDWLPYINFTGEKPKGILPELISAYESIIGIPIRHVKTSNWNECTEKTKNGEIDIADLILKNPNTLQHLTPSKTYISDFLILISKVEKPYISDIADADTDNMNVAIVSTYKNIIQYVKKQYPNLHLTYVKDLKEGLKKVSKGQVDAYMGIFLPTTFMINKQYIKELKINGRFSELELEGAFGVRSDEPLLVSIMNKAIDALAPIRKREIIHSWISVKQEKGFDYSLFGKILWAIVILLLIFGYRQHLLKRENKKLKETALKLSHQAQIIEQISDSVISTDLDGYIMNWNLGSEILLGYSADETIGKHVSMIYRQKDMPILKENIKILMQRGGIKTEVYLVKKSKDIVPVSLSLSLLRDENGVPLCMVGYAHDMTQYKRSEEILQELNYTLEEQKNTFRNNAKRFQDILDQIPGIAVQGYDEQHKVIYWNHASEAFYGYGRDEALGKKLEDLIIPDTMREAVNEAICNWIDNGIKIPSSEVTLKDKNNHPVTVFSQHVLIETEQGDKEMYCLDTDLRHIKETEEKLKQSEKALQALNSDLEERVTLEVEKNRLKDMQMIRHSRLAQMGEMISMIAHQWRQPLAAISATSATINLKATSNKLDKDTTINLTNRISDFSQHLSNTIDDFRGFFKSNKEKSDINYTELVKSILGIIESSLSTKNINFIQDLNIEDTFKSYPNEIKQVILNLIRNSEEILLEKEIKDPYIKISTFRENDDLVLTVSDNGGGISEDIIDNIFDPYFSTKEAKDGTGLGLYMSKMIIEDHCGGKLSVKNGRDGAIFRIKIRSKEV